MLLTAQFISMGILRLGTTQEFLCITLLGKEVPYLAQAPHNLFNPESLLGL
jgi:hypothetical protein